MLTATPSENMPEIVLQATKIETKDETGFNVETSDQDIRLVISNFSGCCEVWDAAIIVGNKFAGELPRSYQKKNNNQTFDKIHIRDISNLVKSWEFKSVMMEPISSMEETAMMIVTIQCIEGTIKMLVWNEHNGYYPHTATASWNNFTDSQSL